MKPMWGEEIYAEVSQWPKVMQLVNSRAKIQTLLLWKQNTCEQKIFFCFSEALSPFLESLQDEDLAEDTT